MNKVIKYYTITVLILLSIGIISTTKIKPGKIHYIQLYSGKGEFIIADNIILENTGCIKSKEKIIICGVSRIYF